MLRRKRGTTSGKFPSHGTSWYELECIDGLSKGIDRHGTLHTTFRPLSMNIGLPLLLRMNDVDQHDKILSFRPPLHGLP